MRTFTNILLGGIGLLAFMSAWSAAGKMVSAPSDISVRAGMLLYVVLFGTFVLTLKWLGKKGYDYAKEKGWLGLLLIPLLGASSACTLVEPGYVGIVVNMYGDERGVDEVPLETGRVWYNPWTEDVYKFPTFVQNVVWTKDATEGSPNDDSITFNSVEGAVINVDVALSYTFERDKVPSIFREFRQDPEKITWSYLRSQIRDAFSRKASQMKVTDIFGGGKQQLLEQVKADLNERLKPKGFNFDLVSFVGALRVDDKVAAAVNATIEATQKAIEAENKVRQSEAEAKQLIAKTEGEAKAAIARAEGNAKATITQAEAQAKANEILTRSITPQMIQWQATQKWNGVLPQATNGVPFIQLPQR